MKQTFFLLTLLCTTGALATAATCGTVAAPGACFLDVNGQYRYTFSNFHYIAGVANGNVPGVGGDEIALALTAGSGGSAVLAFTKQVTTVNPFSAFSVNSGQSIGFRFAYDVAVTTLTAGTVTLADPVTNFIVTSSSVGNGQASNQMLISNVLSCQATLAATSNNCALPLGTTTLLSTGNQTDVIGGTGNASIGTIRNVFNATFTPDTSSGVPEPSTFALLGLGLAGIYRLRRR